MKVSDLFDHCEKTIWRSHRAKATLRSCLRILRVHVGDLELHDLHYSRLGQLAADLEARGGRGGGPAKPATVKRKMDILSAAMTEATKMTGPDGQPILFAKPPFPSFEIDNIQERTISDEELAVLFEVIGARTAAEPLRDWPRFRSMIRFMLDTACRRGEALRTWPGHIEVIDGHHYVAFQRYRTKNKKPRLVPLSEAIVAMLPELRLQAGNGPLFPFTPGELWGMWKAVRKDMKARGHDFSNVVYHTTRHTSLTKAAKRHPLIKVSRLAGHSSIKVTADRYGHLSPSDLRDVVDTVAA